MIFMVWTRNLMVSLWAAFLKLFCNWVTWGLLKTTNAYTVLSVKWIASGKLLYNSASPAWTYSGGMGGRKEAWEGGDYIYISSITQLCLTPCDPMNRSTPGLPVLHQLPDPTQTQVHWVGNAMQPSHPLLSPSPSALNISQHQGLFKWVSSSHQVAKILEFQLQHQSFWWTPRTDFL